MPQKKMEESETVQSLVPDQPEAAADSEVPTDVSEEILSPVEDISPEPSSSDAEEDAPKPKAKRSTRKKAEKAEPAAPPEAAGGEIDETAPPEVIPEASAEDLPKPAVRRRHPERPAPILTLEAGGDVETEESAADTAWHEIHNAYRTRRILTGMLGGIEQLDNGKTIAIVEYKGFRVVIPLKEMVMHFPNQASGDEYREQVVRHHKLLSNMLGAEIDFVVKGIDSKTRSIVASRKVAMLKKRQTFYMDTDASGTYRIYDGRIVQARVIAVAEKAVRIEAFGVECSIMARDLSWDWIGDAHDRFSVGDQVLVRILSVKRDNIEDLSIKADIKSVSKTPTGTISKMPHPEQICGKGHGCTQRSGLCPPY
ncbi:MAG: S1 RNA-binding domain-containing protein [Lachnospiraceae bacterium]